MWLASTTQPDFMSFNRNKPAVATILFLYNWNRVCAIIILCIIKKINIRTKNSIRLLLNPCFNGLYKMAFIPSVI